MDADSGTIVNDKTHAVESHTDTLDKWNTIYHVNYKWSIPDSVKINSGDTATFTLPSNVEVNTDETCNLIDSNGNVAGTAAIKAGQHTGTITFNNDLSGKTNRIGTLSVGVTGTKNNSSSDSNTQNPNSAGTTTQTKPTSVGQYVGSINKVGWYDKSNSNLINWDIVANLHNGQLYNPVITDNLGPGMEIVPGSIKVQEGYYVNGQFTGAVDVSSAQVSQQGDKIIIKVPSTDLAINVSYQVKIINDNEQNYSNSAEISADNITTAKQSVAELPGHLSGSVNFGNNGSVTIEKYGNNKLLAGAKFVLIDPGHEVVGELSTDKNGLAVFNGLKPGTYYVKEVQAPKGYTIDSTLHEIQVTDDGDAKLTVVDAPTSSSSSNSSSSSSSILSSSSLNSNSSNRNSSSISSVSSVTFTSNSSSSHIYNFSSKNIRGLNISSGKLNVNRNDNERKELPNTGENDNFIYELLGFLLLVNLAFLIKKSNEK